MPQFEAEVVESINPADTLGRNVNISANSAYGKELAKFEQFPNMPWAPTMKAIGNPYRYREYPRMLYRAVQHPRTGKWVTMLPIPQRHEFATDEAFRLALFEAETVNRGTTLVVNDDAEFQKAMESNWRKSQKEALEAMGAQHEDVSIAAAERNWQDRNMSGKAKAEAAAAEAAAPMQHLGEIPRTPLAPRPRGLAALTPERRAEIQAKAAATRAANKKKAENG